MNACLSYELQTSEVVASLKLVPEDDHTQGKGRSKGLVRPAVCASRASSAHRSKRSSDSGRLNNSSQRRSESSSASRNRANSSC